MKIRNYIFFDEYIFKPFLFIINVFVRFIGIILHLDHSLEKKLNTFSICKFKGMGSIIQSTPLIKTIRLNYPGSKIIYVSSVQNKGLLSIYKQNKFIDDYILLNDNNFFRLIFGFIPFLLKLISKRTDVYIDLEIYSSFSSFVALSALAKNRFGYYLRSSQYRLGIYTHMMFFNHSVSINQIYLQMARLLKKDDKIDTSLYEVSIKEENKDLFKITDNYIVINVNASELRYERRWHAEKYTELLNKLSDELKNTEHSIVLIGSGNEKEYVTGIYNTLNNPELKIINLAGKTNLTELISIISNATLMITNDSGPMHIAFSQGIKTICLFGPCHPHQYGTHKNTYTIYKNVYCSPCVHEFMTPPCKGNNVCMHLIEVEEVYKLTLAVLQNREIDASKYVMDENFKTYKLGGDILGTVKRLT